MSKVRKVNTLFTAVEFKFEKTKMSIQNIILKQAMVEEVKDCFSIDSSFT